MTNTNITNAGTPFTLTITMSQCAQVKSKIMRTKPLLGFGNSFEGVANSDRCGRFRRSRPHYLTLINNTAVY